MAKKNKQKVMDDHQQAMQDGYKSLDQLVHGIPSGAFGSAYDPDDVSTHWASPDPDEQAFAEEYFGITPDNHNEGLGFGVKQKLYDMGERQLLSTSPRDVQRGQKRQKRNREALDDLWREWSTREPELAEDHQGSVNALRGVLGKSQLDQKQLRKLVRKNPQRAVDMLADEYYNTGRDEVYEYSGGGETHIPGGGAPRSSKEEEEPEQPSNMFEELQAWQRRSGFMPQ